LRFSLHIQKGNNDAYRLSWILKNLPPREQRVKIGNEVQEKVIPDLTGAIVPSQWNCGAVTAPTTVSGLIFVLQPKSTDPLRSSDLANDNGSQFKITRQKARPS
jgi:hypothetical protein